MATSHTIKQGDHISRIAAQYGFYDYRLIWDDPANAGLKKMRLDPHVLLPGDVLQIPDKKRSSVSKLTGARHKFKIVAPMLKVRLAVRDFDNVPVANAPCELEIDGVTFPFTTNGDGLVEKDVPATAEHGRLRVPSLGLDVPLKIGHLDPLDEETGWLGRLINLGYIDEALGTTDPRELQSDIEEFQCDFGLKVTGLLDAPTKAKLKQIHGS